MAWTTPATWASGDWNLQIRDNLTYLYEKLLPAGTILAYAGSSLPDRFLYCNGTSVPNASPFTDLYAALPGSGTKATPNLVDKFIVAAGSSYSAHTSGGAATVDLTHSHSVGTLATAANEGGGTTGTDGSHDHTFVASGNVRVNVGTTTSGGTLVAAASHTHSFNSHPGHSHSTPNHAHTITGSTANTSGLSSVTNIPPYYALVYIIKY